MKVMLASGNQGKLAELQLALSPLGFELIPQPKTAEYDVEETGSTFVENAIIKARHASALSGLPCIADDSGLMVSALNDKPGVRTARFAGVNATSEDNMALMLEQLEGKENRAAQFCCVLVFVRHANDPLPVIATATWSGEIAIEKSGADGFGYDPIFYVPTHKKTAAELSREEKQSLSHRGQAVAILSEQLANQLGQKVN
ncbi:RdgB/HAM1 family non-canonical purine NTP pyrophosphatase [Marinicella rhabdoformis]|uniref:RdgB/HAM1 family non-canonical purine NTP pyrophosphatase n=1 Tax=Marinicella rhabdoformis TaxID=2580566 RepID=UPI0012AEB560|nr:RdgB/HAM1 family non-canonical purine NTP pyrophosphatase [Marinicella rhabdoformis]